MLHLVARVAEHHGPRVLGGVLLLADVGAKDGALEVHLEDRARDPQRVLPHAELHVVAPVSYTHLTLPTKRIV